MNCSKTLTFREREIIRLRYGLVDGYSYTLEECGRIFKVTRETRSTNRSQSRGENSKVQAELIASLRSSKSPA